MMKRLILAGLLSIGLAGCESPSNGVDLFYMYNNEEGAFFLDPSADVENVIFVDNDSLNDWDIPEDLHHGTKFVGEFDSTGWELNGIQLEGGSNE